jgi:antirestriction protein ArdC
VRYKEKIKIVEKWLEAKGITLRWSNNHSYDPETNEVFVSRQGSDKNVFYTLLHETGHAIQYNMRTPPSFTNYDPDVKTLVTMYHNMSEEIDAWQRGYDLAKRLKIPINQKDYDKYAAKYVATYIYYWNDSLRAPSKK